MSSAPEPVRHGVPARTRRLSLLLALALTPLPAAAQTPAENAPLRYEDAVSDRALQRSIRYAEEGEPLDLDAAPRLEREDRDRSLDPDLETARPVLIVVAGALLAFILAAAIRHGAGAGGVFSRGPADARRRRPEQAPEIAEDEAVRAAAARPLDELRAMADRRLAVSALVTRALRAAVRANDMRLGRSQTARDVLRATPRGWPHYDALSRLVRQAETVVFGGRAMSDPEFDACLDLARPILAAESPGRRT
ncbi:MAG: DUF4129 domain-containing protein [Pseudomonadota bacterium]